MVVNDFIKGLVRRVALLLLVMCVANPGYAAEVTFRWAILSDSGDGMQPLNFSGSPPIVFSGTGLQIYLEHLENCHIYFYLLGQKLGIREIAESLASGAH